jgi:signal transduction histidine kinase
MDSRTVVVVGLLATICLAAAVYGLSALSVQRRHARASLSAIDFARGSFASQLNHGVAMNELLLQLVEALRDTFKLDSVELWLFADGHLALAASEPTGKRSPIGVTPAEQSIASNAPVSSAAWAKVWVPDLLDGKVDRSMRVAPISQGGQLLGLIVVERSRKAERLAAETDETLAEVAREVGVALNKARLDAALENTLDQLRRQADELQASRGRLVAAADAERRRIERDLHDGAQQHLIAMAIKARLIEQLAATDPGRALDVTHQLQQDASAALDELRSLAHGIYPPLLSSGGLSEAVPSACRRAPLTVTVDVKGVSRHPAEVESAVYFCCLEALQNAAKYAGESAEASVRVWNDNGNLRFAISDTGVGFATNEAGEGVGLTNMRDRLGAVGGTLEIESAPGKGTRIRGAVPLTNIATVRLPPANQAVASAADTYSRLAPEQGFEP